MSCRKEKKWTDKDNIKQEWELFARISSHSPLTTEAVYDIRLLLL